jgi:hypothetical protein
MPYIGRSTDGFGVRNRFLYLASASDTSVSGADANGATLTFTDGAYVDVYLNGVLLKAGTDYNTNTANTIAGLSALASNDEVTVIVYDVFTVGDMVSATSGGTFTGNVTHNGTVTFGSTVSGLDVNGTEIILDADGDTTITADTDDQIDIKIAGADDFQFTANTFTAQSGSTIAAQALTATTVTASGIIKTDDTTDATSTTDGSLQTDGGLSVAKDAVIGDDLSLKSDSAVLNFGADNDITITHVADKGLIVKSGTSGATAPTYADDLVVEHGSYNGGIAILTGGTNNGRIVFGDDDDNDVGQINYDHSSDGMSLVAGGNEIADFAHSSNANIIRSQTQVNLADDASIYSSQGMQGLVIVTNVANGLTGIYRIEYQNPPILISGNSSFVNSDTDGKMCLISASNSNNVTFRNRFGSTYGFILYTIGGNY